MQERASKGAADRRVEHPPLLIRRVDAVPVALPLKTPMKMSGVTIAKAENLLVRIEAADGTVGWGEAASAPTMTGETMESMAVAVRYMAPALNGGLLADIDKVGALMDRAMYGNNAAKAAVEMAWHDALGKVAGKPVYELLGGKRRDRVPALWMLASGNADADVADAAQKAAAGYVAFKIKVGVS